MVSLRNVSKQFPGSRGPAVTDLSLEVGTGQIVVLVGPSGCGKTTTMRMINRLIEPTSGTITAAGQRALREYGVTPPPEGASSQPGRAFVPLASLRRVERTAICPFCGSEETVVESAFGPTLCRSIHFCRSCRNPFEAFKPKTASA